MKNGNAQVLAYSVEEFCKAHCISRGLFYLLLQRGSGPKIMKLGRRTLVSAEAAAKWREQMQTANPLAKGEHA